MKILIVIAMLWSLPAFAEEKPKRTILQNWGKYCALCHGNDGKATEFGLKKGAPEDMYKASDGKTVEQIFKVITEGGQWMRGFEKKMSEEERREMAVHIEYTTIINRVIGKRERIKKELEDIERDYEALPKCEPLNEGWLWK
jgi:cytochrome c553